MILSDGNSEIDFRKSGYNIQEITSALGGSKEQYEESGMISGRRVISKKLNLNQLSISILIFGSDQDEAFLKQQSLLSMLRRSVDYWTSSRAESPVYIKDKAPGETNFRYASVFNCQIQESSEILNQPFNQPGCESVISTKFSVWISNWESHPPNQYSETTISTDREMCLEAALDVRFSGAGDEFTAFTQLPTGRILAYNSTDETIYYSDDLGASLAALGTLPGTAGTAIGRDMKVAPSGTVVILTTTSTTNASDRGVWRSNDSGATWIKLNNPHGSYKGYFTIFVDEDIMICCGTGTSSSEAQLLVSDNEFIFTLTEVFWSGKAPFVVKQQDGRYLAMGANSIISSNPASAWFLYPIDLGVSDIIQGAADQSRRVYLIPEGSFSLSVVSDDLQGDFSFVRFTTIGHDFQAVGISGDTVYVALEVEGIYKSDDSVNWYAITTEYNTEYFQIINLPYDYRMMLSARDATDGVLATFVPCITVGNATKKYISNTYQDVNILYIKHYDDSTATYTDIFDIDGNYELFPSPAANDYVYFGIPAGVADDDTSPPFSLVFDLSVAGSGITWGSWEAYTGSWSSGIGTQDSTVDGIGVTLGVSGLVALTSPAFQATTIDGVSAFWIRIGISSVSSPTSPIVKVNPYSANTPYIDIPEVNGDLNSHIKTTITHPYTLLVSLPDEGKAARIIAGVRSKGRGTNFRAYLGSKQLPEGITVSLGTDSSSTTDNQYSAYGAVVDYSSVITDSWENVLTYTFDNISIVEYFGSYRLFVRGVQRNGTVGQVKLRYSFRYGAGGLTISGKPITVNVESASLTSWDTFGTYNLGIIKIPSLPTSNVASPAEESTLTIQINQSSATPDFTFVDVVLIPSDEWICDYVSKEQDLSNIDTGYYFTFQNGIKTISKNTLYTETDLAVGSFLDNAASEPQIRTEDQRMWFLIMSILDGEDNKWAAPRYLIYEVTMENQSRYLIGRGKN